MKTTLKLLFDYQKFDPDPSLQAVVDSVHESLGAGKALTDDEADIWAAGEADPFREPTRGDPYDRR